MPDTPPQGNPLPKSTALVLAAAAVVGIAIADFITGKRVNLSTLFVVPMIVAAAAVYRKLMWAVTLAGLASVLALYPFMPGETTTAEDQAFLTNRAIVGLSLL